jgi:hypothetical protein
MDTPFGVMSTGQAGQSFFAATRNECATVLAALVEETDTQSDRIRSGLLGCELL